MFHLPWNSTLWLYYDVYIIHLSLSLHIYNLETNPGHLWGLAWFSRETIWNIICLHPLFPPNPTHLKNINIFSSFKFWFFFNFFLLTILRKRERNKFVVLHIYTFMVDSCMYPDLGLNPQPWDIGPMLSWAAPARARWRFNSGKRHVLQIKGHSMAVCKPWYTRDLTSGLGFVLHTMALLLESA